jgi:MOSC domain-containing protein YiiM
MTASEMAMRKFLKQLGVTAHQELAGALAKAVADGKIAAGAEVVVTARVEIADLQFTHDVTANLVAPE